MNNKQKHDDEEWLREKYVEEELSKDDVAALCDVSATTIGRRLEKFGIPIRSRKEASRANSNDKLRDGDWLHQKYVEEAMSTIDIAKEIGSSASTVGSWLRRHDIKVRETQQTWDLKRPDGLMDEEVMYDLYHNQKMTTYEIADHFDVDQHTVCNWMDQHGIERMMRSYDHPNTPDELRDAEWLRQKHIEEKLNITEIAEMCEVHRVTVRNWMHRHDIEPQGLEGEYSANWKEGPQLKRNYGSKWYRFAEKARKRDDYECQRCGINQSEYKQEHGVALDVHHVKAVDTFRHPRKAHTLDNLVTLCRPCHTTVERQTERFFQLAEHLPLAE